jgi:hypothetical protein
MRAIVGCFACLAAMTSLASAAPDSTAPAAGAAPPLPAYYLHGYYKLLDNVPTWQQSDASPWQVVKGEPWIKRRLVKWGYVPVMHDSKPYYCLIDHNPRTGSHVMEQAFICGDPQTVEYIFNTNRTPTIPLYGGH